MVHIVMIIVWSNHSSDSMTDMSREIFKQQQIRMTKFCCKCCLLIVIFIDNHALSLCNALMQLTSLEWYHAGYMSPSQSTHGLLTCNKNSLLSLLLYSTEILVLAYFILVCCYCIVWKFGSRKLWWIWRFMTNLSKLLISYCNHYGKM